VLCCVGTAVWLDNFLDVEVGFHVDNHGLSRCLGVISPGPWEEIGFSLGDGSRMRFLLWLSPLHGFATLDAHEIGTELVHISVIGHTSI